MSLANKNIVDKETSFKQKETLIFGLAELLKQRIRRYDPDTHNYIEALRTRDLNGFMLIQALKQEIQCCDEYDFINEENYEDAQKLLEKFIEIQIRFIEENLERANK